MIKMFQPQYNHGTGALTNFMINDHEWYWPVPVRSMSKDLFGLDLVAKYGRIRNGLHLIMIIASICNEHMYICVYYGLYDLEALHMRMYAHS